MTFKPLKKKYFGSQNLPCVSQTYPCHTAPKFWTCSQKLGPNKTKGQVFHQQFNISDKVMLFLIYIFFWLHQCIWCIKFTCGKNWHKLFGWIWRFSANFNNFSLLTFLLLICQLGSWQPLFIIHFTTVLEPLKESKLY